MSLASTETLEKRKKLYRAIATWLVIVAGYCLGLAWLHGLPPATANTAFSNISVPFELNAYAGHLGWTLGEADNPFLNIGLNFLRLAIIVAAVIFLICRKPRGLVPLALLFQLSLEAGAVTQAKGAFSSISSAALTPSVAILEADAALPAGASPAATARLCDSVGEGAANGSARCNPAPAQTYVHFILMQKAYLDGNAAAASRHLSAIEAHGAQAGVSTDSITNAVNIAPGDEFTLTTNFRWRVMIVRDWLTALGKAPVARQYDTFIMPAAVSRKISAIGGFAGTILGVLGAALFVLALMISKRLKRIARLLQAPEFSPRRRAAPDRVYGQPGQ